MKKTRNELRRDRIYDIIITIVMVLVLIAVGIQIGAWIEDDKYEPKESKQVYYEAGGCAFEMPEDPLETYFIERAIMAKPTPAVMGYDYDYVCRVVMAETGGEYNEDLTLAVCQAIANAAVENNWTPEEVCIKYKYTRPHEYTSDFIQDICDRVFIRGEVYEASGNAQVFYNPSYGHSSYHESQSFVCEIGGVRFFERVDV